jgi:hypothetical protein
MILLSLNGEENKGIEEESKGSKELNKITPSAMIHQQS